MSIAEKILRAKTDYDDVYDAGYSKGKAEGGGDSGAYEDGFEDGKKAEYDAFWDAFQNKGQRTKYQQGFTGFSFSFLNFYPKYDIAPEGNAAQLFYAWEGGEQYNGSLINRLNDCGVRLDMSKVTNVSNMFSYGCISEIPEMDFSSLTGSNTSVFSNCHDRLVKIERLIVNETTTFGTWFVNAKGLETVIFAGTIGQPLDMHWSTNLSRASIESIMDALSTTVSGMPSITLSLVAVDKAFETSEGANDGRYSDEWYELYYAHNDKWSISLL